MLNSNIIRKKYSKYFEKVIKMLLTRGVYFYHSVSVRTIEIEATDKKILIFEV